MHQLGEDERTCRRVWDAGSKVWDVLRECLVKVRLSVTINDMYTHHASHLSRVPACNGHAVGPAVQTSPERFFESEQSGRSWGRCLKVGGVDGIEIGTYL